MGLPDEFPEAARAAGTSSLPVLASLLLISCISDGSNRTGGDYLADHGIVLENPLYHVTVKGFPVDTFWTLETQASHLDDTIQLVGRQGVFTAEARLAYEISDTAQFDSLEKEPGSLRLSLSTPTWKKVGYWTDNGDSVMRSIAAASGESLGVEILSWVWTNKDLSKDQWKDSLADWNRRYLRDGDTLAVLPQPTVIDTAHLAIRGAYDLPGQLQAVYLPHLESKLLEAPGAKHMVQMRLVPLASADSADSLPAMLRFGGNWPYVSNRLMPSLLFGGDGARSDSLGDKNRVLPYHLGGGVRAVNYTLRYGGPRTDMVAPMQRGLHLELGRDRLYDSLEAGLRRQGIVPPPRSGEPLSLAYYVPFAAVTLPTEPVSLEGDLPIQVKLFSAVDTLLADNGSRVDRLLPGDSVMAWYTTEVGRPDRIVNRISLIYTREDSLRRVILSFSRDSVLNDTVFPAEEGRVLISRSLSGYGSNILFVEVESSGDTVTARSYMSLRTAEESNSYRDPETGKSITDLEALLPRFLHTADTAIRLRGTAGIQTLLNRKDLGADARQQFEFRPLSRAYNPKAVYSNGTVTPYPVSFPVLSTLRPKLENGLLTVDLDVYLYPLGAR